MRVGLKKRGFWGVKRIGLEGKIERIEKKETPINSEGGGLRIFFKGLEGLGGVNLSSREVKMIIEKASSRKK